MAKFLNTDLAELAHQLTLSPKRLRVGQTMGIGRLLGLVDPDRAYPYDFVCYHITEYRKRGPRAEMPDAGKALIPGKALISDLVSMADVITRKAGIPAADLEETHKSHDELAEELNVSTKTVRRWRSRGLMGVWVVHQDGVCRLAFPRSSIDIFVDRHRALVEKGSAFRQLTETERTRIVERARDILADRRHKLNVVSRMISEETGRAIETVRYTLRRYDRSGEGTPLFSSDGQAVLSERHAAIWKCRQAGESLEEIASAFDSTPDQIAAVLRDVQVRKWNDTPLEYIHNELFDAPNADELILDIPEPPSSDAPLPKAPKELPSYLRSLYLVPLLTREQEGDLFRRYNYLKCRTGRDLKAIRASSATQEQVESIREAIIQTQSLKQRLIRANLRLVVSIARKHVGWSPAFFDVISDGNISLLRAIEKFDYSLGNKFSTYATWAIVKNYARSIPESHYRNNRYVTGQEELLNEAPDRCEEPVFTSDLKKVRDELAEGMSVLSERERAIVAGHFGLSGSGDAVTLEQLGHRYGVTKERIRQIERRALTRLREVLAPSLIDAISH